MSAEVHPQRWKDQAVGWLVSTVGRDFMVKEAERAVRAGELDIALVLRDWTERLTSEGDPVLPGHREILIRRATEALEEAVGYGVWEEGEAQKWADVALRGAGVIR